MIETLTENKINDILIKKYNDLKESDNWASLDVVGQFISNSLKQEYKVKSLKKFIEKSNIFEIIEKQNKKGKTLLFYKIKDVIEF